MGIKQLYNDNLRKLPNEYGDVSVMRNMRNKTVLCYPLYLLQAVRDVYDTTCSVHFIA